MSPEILPGPLAPTVAEAGAGPPPRPKLRRSERIPDPGRWRDVIPPVLAELIADSEQFAAHRMLVERVEQAASKVAELRAAHARAVEADAQAEAAFAEGRRGKLPPASEPAAAEAVERAERELQLVERQLPASADRVLAEAHPQLDEAAAQLERAADEGDEQVEAHLAAALAVLDERAEVSRQARWVEQACWEAMLSPYDGQARPVASDKVAAELRRTLGELTHVREEAARRRHERRVEVAMHFHEDRSPRAHDGRSLQERRAEAEQLVTQREQAGQ
jgi:hypothetical protein